MRQRNSTLNHHLYMAIQVNEENIWDLIREELLVAARTEPALACFFETTILQHTSLEDALAYFLASKLDAPNLQLEPIFKQAFHADPDIAPAIRRDILAFCMRDSACKKPQTALLFYKGLHALESWRAAHWLWQQQRFSLALFLQHRISVVFGIDIHPAATIGSGILLDHGSGIVIGETAVIEDDVSIMQAVTLGGTGKESGDRHPKIRRGVLIGAGAKILGNIDIGEGAQIAAGSVVLKPVAAHTLVAGVPAQLIGKPAHFHPALQMDHRLR